jgi:serine/threonine protein phosphatase PrpC
MKEIPFAGLSDRGRIREENQDRWFADPRQGLFIVSDGLGGHAAGGLASRIVVEALPALLRQRMKGVRSLINPAAADSLASCLSELSLRVYGQSKDLPGLAGMGATAVAALFRGARALVAHLGDSRAYLYRAGTLERLTRDHSIVQILVDSGEIGEADAPAHPARGQVTRYVGMPGEALPEVRLVGLRPADRLLLCCDGLTDMLSEAEINLLLRRKKSARAACRGLVDAANEAGGRDNITAIVIDRPGRKAPVRSRTG